MTVRLVARRGRWFPEEAMGAGLDVEAFADEGEPLRNPGPLIRVPEGTEIRASVRNALPGETLVAHGLLTRQARVAISVGETYDFACTPSAPGTLRLDFWSLGGTRRCRSVPVRIE
ncbi:MAG: hypothetical protein ABSB58_00720 [Gemmatimonadales bacterium]